MPYATDADLPARIRHSLPAHAREIFRAAFNAAYKSYGSSPRREEIAHRVAWAAVKKRYVKTGDDWVERGLRCTTH